MSCQVVSCKNTYENTKPKSGEERSIHFYGFPKEPFLSNRWATLCGISPEKPRSKRCFVCSVHFLENAYLIKARMGFTGTRARQLNAEAIPTLHLPEPVSLESNLQSFKREHLNNEKSITSEIDDNCEAVIIENSLSTEDFDEALERGSVLLGDILMSLEAETCELEHLRSTIKYLKNENQKKDKRIAELQEDNIKWQNVFSTLCTSVAKKSQQNFNKARTKKPRCGIIILKQ